jgi:acetylornithine deacetylase
MPKTLEDQALLARLVAFDSTSHNSNLPIAEFLCEYLDRPGIEVVRNPSPDGLKTNLVVRVGPEVDGVEREGLMLSGHMDVVPALEPEWLGDPFELRQVGDRLIGRGASDMKGFVALAVNRAVRAAEAGDLTRPLVLVLTYDEEVGTLGARHFVKTWPEDRPLPRHGIIGEPTCLEVVRLHKGHLKMRLTFTGLSAHSGYPHLGRNAIEPAGRVIVALTELRRELEAERPSLHELFPEVPFVALNVATVHGGAAVNIVPDRCVLELGGRVLPGMTSTELEERLRQRISQAAEGAPYSLEILSESPPLLVEDDAPICRTLKGLVGQTKTISASYATDGGWLQQLGIDCAIWGPGSIEVAHKPEEFMPIPEYRRGAELLDEVITAFCR